MGVRLFFNSASEGLWYFESIAAPLLFASPGAAVTGRCSRYAAATTTTMTIARGRDFLSICALLGSVEPSACRRKFGSRNVHSTVAVLSALMARLRALAATPNDLFRTLAIAALWIALHIYAARPLLVVARPAAWAVVMLMPFVSILPLWARRDRSLRSRSLAHWIGYASLSLFSLLLTLVLLGDVTRIGWFVLRFFVGGPALSVRGMSYAILGAAAVLGAVGFAQARRPRVVRLAVELDRLPE